MLFLKIAMKIFLIYFYPGRRKSRNRELISAPKFNMKL